MGQFAETAWQYCLYSMDQDEIKTFYPLFKEIADYYLLNLILWDNGSAKVRPCTDYDEMVYPVENGLYTMCAAIRSLELAAHAGEGVGESKRKIAGWKHAAESLRDNIPVDPTEGRYLTAAEAKHHHIAEAGPVFPFRIDTKSEMALRSLDSFCNAVRTESGLQPGSAAGYGGRRWLWTASHVAAAYSLVGQPEKAIKLLREAPLAAGPGLAPVESKGKDGDTSCPFFTTSAGALLFSVNMLFVQVTDEGITRLPPLPSDLEDPCFKRLAGAKGLRVSARYNGGKLSELVIWVPEDCTDEILISERIAPDEIAHWGAVIKLSRDGSYLRLKLSLSEGDNSWPLSIN